MNTVGKAVSITAHSIDYQLFKLRARRKRGGGVLSVEHEKIEVCREVEQKMYISIEDEAGVAMVQKETPKMKQVKK